MNQAQYKTLKRYLIDGAQSVEDSKRPAYTVGSADVLSNFKRVGEQSGVSSSQCCLIYLLKHVDSVRSYVKDKGIDQAEPMEGRFMDLINYVCLLAACLEDEAHALDKTATDLFMEKTDDE